MAAPDLTFAQAAVEELMTDQCLITRDTEGAVDDIVDPTTLALTPAAGTPITIWAGKCGIAARNPSGQSTQGLNDEGQAQSWAARYTLKTPRESPLPAPGDVVTVTASRDSGMVGQVFRVIGPTFGSFRVSRRTEIELRTT